MRRRSILLALASAMVSQSPVAAQDAGLAATPADSSVSASLPADDVLTWAELPDRYRRRADSRVGRVSSQAVLHVDEPLTPDNELRRIDHGDLVFVQAVRPAGVARITRSVRNGPKYGPVNAVLWPAVGPQGDYWCWRRDDPATPVVEGNIYCYLDKNGDGVSELVMENDAWSEQLRRSRFQFLSFGHNENLAEQAEFVVEPETVGDLREVVALRYYGATRGLVGPNNRFGPGIIEFELLAGPSRRALDLVRRVVVEVDAHGRGEFHDFNGIHVIVDGVHIDGTARIRVLSGLTTGRVLLQPTPTRELILDRANQVLLPDGSPRPGAIPLDLP